MPGFGWFESDAFREGVTFILLAFAVTAVTLVRLIRSTKPRTRRARA